MWAPAMKKSSLQPSEGTWRQHGGVCCPVCSGLETGMASKHKFLSRPSLIIPLRRKPHNLLYEVLARVWRKGKPCTPLVGLQINAAITENSMEGPPKIKNCSTICMSRRSHTGRDVSLSSRHPHGHADCSPKGQARTREHPAAGHGRTRRSLLPERRSRRHLTSLAGGIAGVALPISVIFFIIS